MKILLSIFACAPNTGSETGGGWRWALELARAGHEVVALTDESRRVAIERQLSEQPVPGLTVVCYRPGWLRAVPLNAKTAQLLFSAWQYSLLPKAKELHRKYDFDVAIHLTYGVFRNPSFLGRLGIPFIFGPVGGGEDAPWALKRGLPLRELFKEALRTASIKLAKYNPFLRYALRSADLILCRTPDTRRELPAFAQRAAIIFQEIGIDAPEGRLHRSTARRTEDQPLEVLFAGRLLGWKGIHLCLEAISKASRSGQKIKLTIIGSGPLEQWLKSRAKRLQIAEHITWHSHMPQQDLFSLYGSMHCLLFPSLHDSGGNVVLEAMSFGLPVICLNLGGPATLVNEHCASVIAVDDGGQDAVTERLAAAVVRLGEDEELRLRMSRAASERAAEMSWASRPAGALALLSQSKACRQAQRSTVC